MTEGAPMDDARLAFERLHQEGPEASMRRWREERMAMCRTCPHEKVTYRSEDWPRCDDCEAVLTGRTWRDPWSWEPL